MEELPGSVRLYLERVEATEKMHALVWIVLHDYYMSDNLLKKLDTDTNEFVRCVNRYEQ